MNNARLVEGLSTFNNLNNSARIRDLRFLETHSEISLCYDSLP